MGDTKRPYVKLDQEEKEVIGIYAAPNIGQAFT